MNVMKKTHKIVMLPTEALTMLRRNTYKFTEEHGNPLEYGRVRNAVERGYEYQHLYILSDDEIKEGDWCVEYGIHMTTVTQWKLEPIDTSDYKKIIATTDSNLRIGGGTGLRQDGIAVPLPQIPQYLVEEYVKQGGFDEVELEYDYIPGDGIPGVGDWYELKLINNEVVISIPKPKTYTREEVEILCERAYREGNCWGKGYNNTLSKEEWIKANL